jgi:hypothetical protein
MGMDVQTENLTSVSAARLLHQAAQNIEAARLLLERGYECLSPEASEALATAVRLEALLPSLMVSSPYRTDERDSPHAQERKWTVSDAAIDRVNERFGLTGEACARVLLYLVEHADTMVSVQALAHAVGLRARSTGVIKVYVCRLRKAFVERGFSSAAFETGTGSYSFRSALHPELSVLLGPETANDLNQNGTGGLQEMKQRSSPAQ